jgi:hypothetical protein
MGVSARTAGDGQEGLQLTAQLNLPWGRWGYSSTLSLPGKKSLQHVNQANVSLWSPHAQATGASESSLLADHELLLVHRDDPQL